MKSFEGENLSAAGCEAFGGAPPLIPDHKLLRPVGRGSYGEVWLARTALGAYRAVKVVHQKSFESERPYEREFSGIKRFEPISRSHEGFVDILQVGRNQAQGYFYYVMELADDANAGVAADTSAPTDRKPTAREDQDHGLASASRYAPKTLRSEINRQGRLPMEQCLQLALSLTSALGQLHKQGLVHRDIKPSNIIFVSGQPKLADIGLVATVTEARSFVGTMGFIPPEGPGTPQADLYSLGKLLYEMSTGKDRNEFPELPTNAREMPDRDQFMEFNEVLLKACHGQPEKRYPSAEEMHADLALLQSGKSVRRLRAMESRLAWVTRLGVTALVVTGIALGAFWYQKVQAQRAADISEKEFKLRQQAEAERQRAVAAETLAKTEASKSQQVARILQEMLEGVRPSVALGRDTALFRDLLVRTESRLTNELQSQSEVVAELLTSLGRAYHELGDNAKAESMLRQALTLRRKLFSADDPKVGQTLQGLAVVLCWKGELEEAERLERLALAILRRAFGNEDPGVANSLEGLGVIYLQERWPVEAEKTFREVLAIRRKLFGDEHLEVARALGNLAGVLVQQGKLVEAEAMSRQNVALCKKLVGNEHPEVIRPLDSLAAVLRDQDKLEEAETLYREVLALQKKFLGDDHPDLGSSLDDLCDVLARQGKKDELMSVVRAGTALGSAPWRQYFSERLQLLTARVGSDPPPGCAALVDGWPIKQADVHDMMRDTEEVYRRTFLPQNPAEFERRLEELKKETLDRIIDRVLIFHDFERRGGQVKADFVQREVDHEIRMRFGDTNGSTNAFLRLLDRQGMTMQQFRKERELALAVDWLQQSKLNDVPDPTPGEVEQYYTTNLSRFQEAEQIKLRMISLKASSTSPDGQALQLAQKILAQLDAGASFTQMASNYSEGWHSSQGGDWGWIETSKLKKGLSQIAFALTPCQPSPVVSLALEGDAYWTFEYDKSGQIVRGHKYTEKDEPVEEKLFANQPSDLAPTPQEFYLMLVEEKRPAHTKSLAEVRDEIWRLVREQKRSRAEQDWLNTLRTNAVILRAPPSAAP